MEETQTTAPETAVNQKGITEVASVEARNALALAVIGTEIVTNQASVNDKANEVIELLTEKFGGASLTLIAALFSIAMEQAPDFATKATLDIAAKFAGK